MELASFAGFCVFVACSMKFIQPVSSVWNSYCKWQTHESLGTRLIQNKINDEFVSLLQKMEKAHEHSAFISCAISVSWGYTPHVPLSSPLLLCLLTDYLLRLALLLLLPHLPHPLDHYLSRPPPVHSPVMYLFPSPFLSSHLPGPSPTISYLPSYVR